MWSKWRWVKQRGRLQGRARRHAPPPEHVAQRTQPGAEVDDQRLVPLDLDQPGTTCCPRIAGSDRPSTDTTPGRRRTSLSPSPTIPVLPATLRREPGANTPGPSVGHPPSSVSAEFAQRDCGGRPVDHSAKPSATSASAILSARGPVVGPPQAAASTPRRPRRGAGRGRDVPGPAGPNRRTRDCGRADGLARHGSGSVGPDASTGTGGGGDRRRTPGRAAVQTVAPRSNMAWLNAQDRPAGTSGRPPTAPGAGSDRSPRRTAPERAATLVSTGATSSSKAKD